jgi:hypothetical protein
MRREEVFKETSDGKEWKKESGGEDGGKVEGIKRGMLPYAATFSFPPMYLFIGPTSDRLGYKGESRYELS